MRFPVNFTTIEDELAPLSRFFSGRVLNAGSGNRDISEILRSWGALVVDNCDIVSSIPNAIICDLCDIPKEDESYDTILCNAVLEHLPYPERVMVELRRLLKPNGVLIVCVPFLQPYHPTPVDYRRYTQSGLEWLATNLNFKVLEIRSVHSFAQNISWLIWAHLDERRLRFLQFALWLPIYLATKIFQNAAPESIAAANSFQIVLKK
jgi:SAM-dependent methyltransferase